MKFFLVLLAIAGLASATPKDLQGDLDQILALIPLEDIKAVVLKYVENGDEEVIRVVQYLQGEEWQALVEQVGGLQETQDLIQYLKDAGLDIDAVLQRIHDFINSIEVRKINKKMGRTLREMIDEIEGLISIDDILAKFNELLETSEDFQAFFETIASEETHQLVESVRQLPEVQELADKLEAMGLDIRGTLDTIYQLLGWA